MSIDKSAIRVQGSEAVEPTTGLPMYRRYVTFEGNRELEYIMVYFEQWLESNGVKLEFKKMHYVVKDIAEIGHYDENSEWVVDSPAIPVFSLGWYFKKIKATANGLSIGGQIIAPLDYELNFGQDLIVGTINTTLQGMAFDIQDGHMTLPE